MKIRTHLPSQQYPAGGKIPIKGKINRKRLFIIFSSAFLAFFFVCTLVASMLTPSIDVPALDNEEGSNLTSLTSDDFKGRIDPRLKSLEMQEALAPSTNSTTGNTFKDQERSTSLQDMSGLSQNKEAYSQERQKYETQDFNELPYDNRNSGVISSDNYDDSSNNYQPEKPAVQPSSRPEPQKQDDSLILRDKVKVENEQPPLSMVKVVVGNYSSPMEAKKVSRELTNSNLNVTPFIQERNGIYVLQVGSFSNPQKAANLANQLKKRNIAARIIQD